jgi:hypothetical protein
MRIFLEIDALQSDVKLQIDIDKLQTNQGDLFIFADIH